MALQYDKREAFAVKRIKEAIPSWLSNSRVGPGGMFAELHENKTVSPDHFLASSVDGVGTKLLIAEAMHKFDTVGVDLVAMNANDLATLGRVSPFLFINYFACQEKIESEGITGDIMRGIVHGLEQCDANDILRQDIMLNMGKGETASVDEMLGGLQQGYGFDLAAAMVGFIRKADLPKPEGDTLIALGSSGPHSNGFTELRHKLLKGEFENRPEYRRHYVGKHALEDEFEGQKVGEMLLAPTRIYVKTMAAIAKEFPVFGFNNTGYGLKNLVRVKSLDFSITSVMEPSPIFRLFQKDMGYSPEKMYSNFNMGMGFFVLCKKTDVEGIIKVAQKYGDKAEVIGTAKPGSGKLKVDTAGLKFSFDTYG